MIQLYCNSVDDSVGTPYHYEWISHAPGPLGEVEDDAGVQVGTPAPSPPAPMPAAQRRHKRVAKFCASFAAGHSAGVSCPDGDCCPGGEAHAEVLSQELGSASDDSFLHVRACPNPIYVTEQDEQRQRCAALASDLRSSPTLPPDPADTDAPFEDV